MIKPYQADTEHVTYGSAPVLLKWTNMVHHWDDDSDKWGLGEETVPVPLCPPYIVCRDTRDWTQISAVAGRQLTAWPKAQPLIFQTLLQIKGNKQDDIATMHGFMQDFWFFMDC